jgi:hypothetical protein
MSTLPNRVERRIGQRFPYLLPVSFRDSSTGTEGLGFTQDVSSRGVLFLTDACLRAGCEIELTLNMPSQITLGDDMRVRCRGRILRILRPELKSLPEASNSETKIAVAVRFDRYEYLPASTEPQSSFARVVALHSHHDVHPDPHPEVPGDAHREAPHEVEEDRHRLSMRPAPG